MSEPSGQAAGAAPDGTATVDPAPPEEFVEAARRAPDHWLYLTDPAWSGEGPPPEWAVVGQWRSDVAGEIVEWQDNEEYRPSPRARAWPEPTDDVDAAIQLATTGYGPADDVTAALAEAEVAVLVTAGGDPVSASAPDGTPVVPVYTSPHHLHLVGQLAFERVRVRELLERVPEGHGLCLNSSAPVSMVVNADGLEEAMSASAGSSAEEPVQEEPQPAPPRAARPPTVSAPDHATGRVVDALPFPEPTPERGLDAGREEDR